jgi:glutamate-5-semialdehyde dehydrogenase
MGTEKLIKNSVEAFHSLAQLGTEEKNRALKTFANLIEKNKELLIQKNEKDLKREKGKLSPALYQRLKLDDGKIAQVIAGIEGLIKLEDPVNRVLSETLLDEGLTLQKVSVPLGVVGVIFESRPDVMPQVLSLMLKSGNAVILKGGSEALETNQAFMKILASLGNECKFLPKNWAQLIISRKAVHEILDYPQDISLIIPRGSNALVQAIMKNTKIPVMGHADGICHLYVHSDADLSLALHLCMDSKVQYPSACNAIETLLVHKDAAKSFLPSLEVAALGAGLELRGCEKTKKILPKIKKLREKDWSTEYGDLVLAVKVVASMNEAIEHIQNYGSAHTDGIVAKSTEAIEEFLNRVDSAGVYANASTRFADGFRYGFGAEVGISTGKLHARGPVGLEGLSTYKYKVRGHGQVVADYVGENPKKKFKHQILR